ncbi:MAG TPA: hypothetical protein VLC28_14025 [Flavitalea sp.]|nr:hypothetical protein [Flavitalea sp.]
MANKSSRSNSGEEPDQPVHRRPEGVEEEDIKKNSGSYQPQKGAREQENLKNRGYQEDQPGQPVRNTSGRDDQKDVPAGEPDENEQKS